MIANVTKHDLSVNLYLIWINAVVFRTSLLSTEVRTLALRASHDARGP